MGRTICPYCDIEVSESQIEAEDGCCPECGANLTMSLWGEEEDEDADELIEEELFDEEVEEDHGDDDLDDDDEDY